MFFSEDGDLYLCESVAGEPMLVPFGEKFELASPLEDGLEVRTGGSLIVEFLADPAPTTSGSRYGCAAITEAGIAIVGKDTRNGSHTPLLIGLKEFVEDMSELLPILHEGP